MRFLCLGYYDAAKMDALPKPEIDAIMAQCRPHLDDLHATGQVLLDLGLETETRSIHRADGTVRITQGRVAESPVLVGSAFVIEAHDFDAAVALAAKHPSTQVPAGEQFGWAVEIRPIHTYRAPTAGEPLKA